MVVVPQLSEEERKRLDEAYLYERELNEAKLLMTLMNESKMPDCFELVVVKLLYYLVLHIHKAPDGVFNATEEQILKNLPKY